MHMLTKNQQSCNLLGNAQNILVDKKNATSILNSVPCWEVACHSIVWGQNLPAVIPSHEFGAMKTSPPSLQAHVTGCYGISWSNTCLLCSNGIYCTILTHNASLVQARPGLQEDIHQQSKALNMHACTQFI